MVGFVKVSEDILSAGFPPVRYLMNTEMDTVPLSSSWLAFGLLGSLMGIALCAWVYRALKKLDPQRGILQHCARKGELWGVFVIALAIRVFNIFTDPLTEFEMTSVLIVERSEFIPGIHELVDAASRGHFPFLIWITWIFQGLSGEILGGRIPSALAGSLAITILARTLGRDLEIRSRLALYAGLSTIPMGVFMSRWTAGYPWVLLGEAFMLQGVFLLRADRERQGWTSLMGGLLICASFQANGVFSGLILASVWIVRMSRGGLARRAAILAVPAGLGVVLIGSPWFITISTHAQSMKLVGDFLPYLSLSPFGLGSDIAMLMHWTLDLGYVGALPVAGLIPVCAGLIAAGILRVARVDRELTALTIGLLLTFVVVFVNMAFGPYLFKDIEGVYFHMRQHCVLVVLGALALWGWLRVQQWMSTGIGFCLALLFIGGWINLEGKERQPDYKNAFSSIAAEFQAGDSILILPSYTNWSVLQYYGLKAAKEKQNTELKKVLDLGYEQPRFIVPMRVPLEDQLRSNLVQRLWVMVVDDRVWGVYPHYNFEYTKRGVADVDSQFIPRANWTHEGFMAWRLMHKKKVDNPWSNNEQKIQVGVDDLYFLEGVQPPPLIKTSKRYLTLQTILQVDLPEESCGLQVALKLNDPADSTRVSMNPTRDEQSWTEGATQEFDIKRGKRRFQLKIRASEGPSKVWFSAIELKASPCETEASEE